MAPGHWEVRVYDTITPGPLAGATACSSRGRGEVALLLMPPLPLPLMLLPLSLPLSFPVSLSAPPQMDDKTCATISATPRAPTANLLPPEMGDTFVMLTVLTVFWPRRTL